MAKHITHIALIVLVLGAFFLYSYNAYFNGHYHLLQSGQWIFHAHPHSAESHNPHHPSHSHTKLQWLSYELLLAAFIAILIIYVFSTTRQNTKTPVRQQHPALCRIPQAHPRRAPPRCI